MPLRPDRGQQFWFVVESWNRRVHYYLGLYFLLFIWLFSFTGLLLNHPRWALSRIPNDPGSAYERTITPPAGDTDVTRANDVIRQLGLRGELDWPLAAPKPGRLEFNLAYPKRAYQVSVDLVQNRATVRPVERTLWSALRITHTFSGSRYNSPSTRRDWALTTVWVIAMNALAVGLVVMVLGSYYMWYRLKAKRRLGWLALSAGVISCGVFVIGLLQ